MAHKNYQCIAREYLNFEYDSWFQRRWLCEQCFKQRQWQQYHYRNHEDAIEILEKDVENFKINRQSLLQHLHKLFNKHPIQTNHKIQLAQEISMINALFLDMINNPFNEQELRKLDDILNTIRDISRFKELTEFEIKQILSIGRGHYQCDNSKVQQILNIMMNIDELKSSNLVVYLKLITNQSEVTLCYQQPYDELRLVDKICISNNLLLQINFLGQEDTCCIYAIKNFDNNPKNHFQFLLKGKQEPLIQTESLFFGRILILKLQSYRPCDNKTCILSIKSKKIIRCFKKRYETIQYEESRNLLIAKNYLTLYFYDINTLKLKNKIKVNGQLENIRFISSMKKVFSQIDRQLAIFDIDQQCLINCLRLDYLDLFNYQIFQQFNIIVLLFKDKIVILDFNFTQLKCIDWSSQQLSVLKTQVSEDMKYLYSNVSREHKLQIFRMSLAN